MKRGHSISRYTIPQQWSSGQCGLFNALRGTTVKTSPEVFQAFSSAKLDSLKPDCIASLAHHGFLVHSDLDEYREYRRARLAHAKHPTVEITYLATGPESDQGVRHDAAAAVAAHLNELVAQTKKTPLLVKLRFCGHSIHPMQDRVRAFETIAKPSRPGLNVVTMWLTDSMHETRMPVSQSAIAVYFRWDLHSPKASRTSVAEAFTSIRTLAAQKRIVLVQIVASDEDDLHNAADDLRRAVKICGDLMGSYICWGIAEPRHSPDVPYLTPPVCDPKRAASVARMCNMVRQLRTFGIMAPLPVLLRHQHGGCPYSHPLSAVFDRNGKRHRCLLHGCGSPVRRTTRKDSPSDTKTLECASCSMLPVCEAACPRHNRNGRSCKEFRESVRLQTDPILIHPAAP